MNTPVAGRPGDPTPPTAPANLTATAVGPTQINLSWTAATDNVAVTGYRVERCQGAGCSTFAEIAAPAHRYHATTTRTAPPARTYRYRVRATDAAPNLGPYCPIATATTPAAADTTAADGTGEPDRDRGRARPRSTSPGRRRPTTSPSPATGSSAARAPAARPSPRSPPHGTGTTYNDTTVVATRTYRYRVRATDAAPNLGPYSARSPPRPRRPRRTRQPPTAPANLTATAVGPTQINLSWTAATDNVAVTGYRVERCQGAGCSTFAEIAAPSGTGTTYNDTTAPPPRSYRYRVRATDAAPNLGPYCPIATATTPAPPRAWLPPTPSTKALGRRSPTPRARERGHDRHRDLDDAGQVRKRAQLQRHDRPRDDRPTPPSLRLTNAMTLEAWVYPDHRRTSGATSSSRATTTTT